ncbi:MAG: glutamine amidotransferase [Alphaproteobacteria bacterium]
MGNRILTVVHSRRSTPGRAGEILSGRGYLLEARCPAQGDALPASLEDYEGVIIFGGPMSVYDNDKPFLKTEMDWIPTVIESGTPLLGVCLGGQLVSKALGAEVAPHPEGMAEVGYFNVRPAGAGFVDPDFHVYQFHIDSLGLPSGAELLATGEIFETQAYRYGDNVTAIQFHPEVTREMMLLWTRAAGDRLTRPGAQTRAEQVARCRQFDSGVSKWFENFLDRQFGRPGES